jgi:uncharacterized metal-binding protein YceD (DUF177 family)
MPYTPQIHWKTRPKKWLSFLSKAVNYLMKIDLRDIREGETEFAFEETPADLHITEEDTQFAGAINTRLVVYKFGDSLSAKGQTTCLVRPECARCLEPIEFPMAVSYTFVFQKGRPDQMNDDDDETLIWLNEEPGEIDLGNHVKDYILLELPMIPTCAALPSGPCERYEQDPHELLEYTREKSTDPRWDALRALKESEQ